MLQEIHNVMGKRDANFKLEGNIALDSAYFEISDAHQKPNKTGCGSLGKAKVQVNLEWQFTGNKYHQKNCKQGRKCVRLKVDQVTAGQISTMVDQKIEISCTVHEDGHISFQKLVQKLKLHHCNIAGNSRCVSSFFH